MEVVVVAVACFLFIAVGGSISICVFNARLNVIEGQIHLLAAETIRNPSRVSEWREEEF
jgi:hypothetical protein